MSNLLRAANKLIARLGKIPEAERYAGMEIKALRLAVEAEKADMVARAAQPSTDAVSEPGKVCRSCGCCKTHCAIPDVCSTVAGVCPECAKATQEQR